MKRCLSMILAAILLLSCIYVGTPKASAETNATKQEITREIAIVFDNSGTMYIGDEDSRKTWCRATYAMQALATMMNAGDKMVIYPMNPIQIGDSDNPEDSDVYTRERPLEITKDKASLIQEIYTPGGPLDTHLEAVTLAREGLEKSDADEKWLIVPTDGTEFYRNNKPLGEEKSIRQLTDEFNKSVKNFNAMYLGIGKAAKSGFKVKGEHQYVERTASNSEEVLKNLTEMGNIIFKRDELEIKSKDISFDVSMKKLILFIQGEAIDNVKMGDATPVSVDKLKYSTYGAKIYKDKQAPDKSLQGTMLTFENLAAGDYKLSFSGKESSVAVYYEPDADLRFKFTDAAGNDVKPEELYEGNYKISFGMMDGQTGELSESKLLGSPRYSGSYYINGEEYVIEYEGFTGEKEDIFLKKDDKFDANLTVTYLSGYTIRKTSKDFGWPDIGITVQPRPAGMLELSISGGQKEYNLETLESGESFIVEVFYDGQKLTGSDLKNAPVVPKQDDSNAKIDVTLQEDHYELKLLYKDPEAPQNTKTGKNKVSLSTAYTPQGSNEVTAKGILEYEIKDEGHVLDISVEVLETYIVIKELESSQPIIVTLNLDGKKLTTNKRGDKIVADIDVDCGPIKYKKEFNPKNSTWEVKLLPTEGIEEGDYTIRITGVYKDLLGRPVDSEEDPTDITLGSMPLWLKWLIRLGLLLLLIIIIWMILHIPAMPTKVSSSAKKCSLKIGGVEAKGSPSFPTERNGKSLSILCKKGTRQFGLKMPVAPGDGSYLYMPSSDRTMKVIAKDVTVVQGGNIKITEANIGKKFIMDPKTKKLTPANPRDLNSVITLTNGKTVTFTGKISENGNEKSFTASIKIDFTNK